MITLTIIGVISAIVVPVAVNSRPDENVMKFKKAHNTFYQVINTLVTSDKYYLNGDLGIKANGELIDGRNTNDYTYFCKSIADVLTVKNENCAVYGDNSDEAGLAGHLNLNWKFSAESTLQQIESRNVKDFVDEMCKKRSVSIAPEIVTTDDVAYFQENSRASFGGVFNRCYKFSIW